jgi:hypothetical protein
VKGWCRPSKSKISGQESAPNSFENAGSIVLTPDRRSLFTTNGAVWLAMVKPTARLINTSREPIDEAALDVFDVTRLRERHQVIQSAICRSFKTV